MLGDNAASVRRSASRVGKSKGTAPDAPQHAERRRARRPQQPPVRSPEYDGLTVPELRTLRKRLASEETSVSYWRRIIQARIDLLENGVPRAGATVEGLSRVLRGHSGASRRTALVHAQPVDGAAPLPDLPALWDHVDDGGRPDPSFLADLHSAEARLSAARTELHRQIDTVTGQLIARYREDPSLALSALPQRPGADRQF